MFPYYKGYIPNIQLNQDDINGIQEIYGMNKNHWPNSLKQNVLKENSSHALIRSNLFNIEEFQLNLVSYTVHSRYLEPVRNQDKSSCYRGMEMS